MLTDIPGIRVGHVTDAVNLTGCTIALFDQPVVAGVDVRGANAATIYTDLIHPESIAFPVAGILLTGGSSFGLEAALGAMKYCETQGWGFDVGVARVPLVPAAVIFDLAVGNAKIRPDLAMGWQVCDNARPGPFERGAVGAGTGATIGKLFGVRNASRGGLGTCTVQLSGGVTVSAMVVVNAFGDVIDPASGIILAGTMNVDRRFVDTYEQMKRGAETPSEVQKQNTTIGIVSCNCRLTKIEAYRMAKLAHNGLARSIRPIHTNVDGDTLFATGVLDSPLQAPIDLLETAAAEAVAGAVLDAVKAVEANAAV